MWLIGGTIGGFWCVPASTHLGCPTDGVVPACRIRAVGGVSCRGEMDLVRESVRLVMQELIETEASERIGAARYERTEIRIADVPDFYRSKPVADTAGKVNRDRRQRRS